MEPNEIGRDTSKHWPINQQALKTYTQNAGHRTGRHKMTGRLIHKQIFRQSVCFCQFYTQWNRQRQENRQRRTQQQGTGEDQTLIRLSVDEETYRQSVTGTDLCSELQARSSFSCRSANSKWLYTIHSWCTRHQSQPSSITMLVTYDDEWYHIVKLLQVVYLTSWCLQRSYLTDLFRPMQIFHYSQIQKVTPEFYEISSCWVKLQVGRMLMTLEHSAFGFKITPLQRDTVWKLLLVLSSELSYKQRWWTKRTVYKRQCNCTLRPSVLFNILKLVHCLRFYKLSQLIS